ncbi:MAG: YicC family protein [Silicimonas sp.]|nr:YicC family protein [Silicimonas sp.]
MTGFASASGVYETWAWSAEMRSVNGRGLDLRIRVPDWVEGLEPELRKLCQGRLARGNVTIGIRITRESDAGTMVLSDTGLNAALSALAEIEAQAAGRGVTLAPTTAAEISHMRGVLEATDTSLVENIPALRAALLDGMGTVLDAFETNRATEGAALARVLGEQLDRIETLTADAAAALGDRDVAARAALDRALARITEATEVPDEARLLQEMALIAVKNDVTEELDRLAAHIAAARALLAQDGARGRKFDFLMQEFNREANTLCSKSQSPALTAIGLDLKAVIDQMREQVQNVE